MSLVFRFTILFILVSLVVFSVGGVITYQIMKREIDLEERYFLDERLENIISYIKDTKPDSTIERYKWSIQPLSILVEETEPRYSDTTVVHSTLGRPEPHIKLEVIKNIDSTSYRISLYDLIIESDDINDVVVESLVKMFLLLLVSFSVLGFLIFYFQMRPFYRTLEVIKGFTLTGKEEHDFGRSSIKEFRRLNLFLDDMTTKVRKDYLSLKEFSENASHELQTPIAIMLGKLDMLLEDENLTEDQMNSISSLQLTAKRLSNLSNSLSLLTKIENREFTNLQEVDIQEKLIMITGDFKELFELKGIQCSSEYGGKPMVHADSVLIEVLITNLINNAIKHNNEKKQITINLTSEALEISNTGDPLKSPPEELFRRFKKSNQSSGTMGLGLAIVKKICDRYGFTVSYRNIDQLHYLKVEFSSKKN